MSETIRHHFQGSDAWLNTLTAGRQKKVTDKWERLNAENLAIDMISASEFCDKRQILLTLNSKRAAHGPLGLPSAPRRSYIAPEQIRISGRSGKLVSNAFADMIRTQPE